MSRKHWSDAFLLLAALGTASTFLPAARAKILTLVLVTFFVWVAARLRRRMVG